VEILGIPVDRLTREEALRRAESFAAERPPRNRLVFTPNPELLMAALDDAELRSALRSADLSLCDGVGVAWAARVLGRPVPERIPGVDFMMALLDRAAERGWRVYLLGTRPEVVAKAAEAARRRGVRVAGFHHGYFPPQEDGAVAEEVARARAHILFAGLGFPKEQRFLAANRHRLGVGLAMGVGGSLDVLAGAVPRAPRVLRQAGLEWAWRLARQPGRWRRQLALPRFVWTVLARRGRRG
jgi:N-acetylglucosaminyldiphosphoundecaprenol N-acetyl-beta-D-mannosaminyltransferase